MLYELAKHNIEMPGNIPDISDDSRIIFWCDNKVVTFEKNIAFIYSDCKFNFESLEFIACLDGLNYFTALVSHPPADTDLTNLRDIGYLSETGFMLCARARAILDWRKQHNFCGQCGNETSKVKNEFAMQCEPCSLRFYPRIAPCIIVLVTNGDKVLLAQGTRHRESGWYSTLAGFIEGGESAEQAVIREVREEVGVEVGNIRYLNSQAWPFPNQLMLGFHADYIEGDIVPQEHEIADARWFELEKLPKYPPSISIAGWLINQYVQERKNR